MKNALVFTGIGLRGNMVREKKCQGNFKCLLVKFALHVCLFVSVQLRHLNLNSAQLIKVIAGHFFLTVKPGKASEASGPYENIF